MTSSTSPARRRRPRRQETRLWRVPVIRVARVTPRMARITVAGPELADLDGAGTDQNVMLYFYPPDAVLPEPLTLESARAQWSHQRPLTRTYTIARHDPVAHEVDFDVVLHGDAGPASAWASRVAVGDPVIFVGPSPAYVPDPEAEAYLLAGDETALPAIAAILRVLRPGVPVRVFVEVADAAEVQQLPTDADAEVTWVHRDGVEAGRGDRLERAMRAAALPTGRVEVWLAGERAAMVAIRAFLLDERGFARSAVRPTTYWRHGETGN